MGFHRSGCLRLEKFPVDGANGIFIPVFVHADNHIHFRCALVDDPGTDARAAQGIKHPGPHFRAANHAPANHRNHGKAIGDNPQGIVASMNMNNLYIETATELVAVFTLLNDAVAKGGTENMLTGAERSKTLWALDDRLSAFSRKLHLLYLSIRYYTLNDVWNDITAGMLDRDNGEAARLAMSRWRRAAIAAR